MSSETSTDVVDPVSAGRGVRLQPDSTDRADQSLQPWQFFVLAALTCATAVTFIVRGQGLITVILLTLVMGTIGLLGLAALRVVRPLMGRHDDRTIMIGERTRTALEREKTLALRAIKELEFDHAMGKIANEDFQEMSARLRSRAMRIMKQLDSGAGYREQIERDLAKRMGGATDARRSRPTAGAGTSAAGVAAAHDATDTNAQPACAQCATANDADAKFCKSCGARL